VEINFRFLSAGSSELSGVPHVPHQGVRALFLTHHFQCPLQVLIFEALFRLIGFSNRR
jgi:hypothetical protein